MSTITERLDLERIARLLAELGWLSRREAQIRHELAELLEQPRSTAADQTLGELMRRLAGAPQS
ncbi:MAG: hypothetical protein ACRETP_12110 [Steroidobacteraceae bacterium]